MEVKIKYKGFFSGNNSYTEVWWDEADIISLCVQNDLKTKPGIIEYIAGVRMHEDSIPDFLKLVKHTLKELQDEETEFRIQKRKIKKIVDKYFK